MGKKSKLLYFILYTKYLYVKTLELPFRHTSKIIYTKNVRTHNNLQLIPTRNVIKKKKISRDYRIKG